MEGNCIQINIDCFCDIRMQHKTHVFRRSAGFVTFFFLTVVYIRRRKHALLCLQDRVCCIAVPVFALRHTVERQTCAVLTVERCQNVNNAGSSVDLFGNEAIDSAHCQIVDLLIHVFLELILDHCEEARHFFSAAECTLNLSFSKRAFELPVYFFYKVFVLDSRRIELELIRRVAGVHVHCRICLRCKSFCPGLSQNMTEFGSFACDIRRPATVNTVDEDPAADLKHHRFNEAVNPTGGIDCGSDVNNVREIFIDDINAAVCDPCACAAFCCPSIDRICNVLVGHSFSHFSFSFQIQSCKSSSFATSFSISSASFILAAKSKWLASICCEVVVPMLPETSELK